MSILDLDAILTHLQPELDLLEYVFCTVNGGLDEYAAIPPLACFQEKEGLSLVLTKRQAKTLGINTEVVFRRITLTVYSSLEAVGLTAVVATVLAKHGISANMVAAYYHDHVFCARK